jgi:methyl-accepting chemotaxis protein
MERAAEGDLSARMDRQDDDVMDSIAASVDAMMTDIEEAMGTVRSFAESLAEATARGPLRAGRRTP